MLRVDIREPDHRSLETHSPASCKADKKCVHDLQSANLGGGRWEVGRE